MKRKSGNYSRPASTWLITYADLMNNLLILFILLFSISTTNLQKFKALAASLNSTFGGGNETTTTDTSAGNETTDLNNLPVITEAAETTVVKAAKSSVTVSKPIGKVADNGSMNNLDEFIKKITNIVKEKGYGDKILIEKVDNYVYFRFREGVLFYPNLSELKPDSYDILKTVADIIQTSYKEIYKIEICGHTAWVEIDNSDTNFNSWELSSDRSLTVLKFFVSQCGIPKDKMVMSAYSSTDPYTEGKTEEEKAMNRRVEIRLSRVIDAEK